MRILAATSFIALTTLSIACGGGNDDKPDAPPIVVPDAAIDAFVPDAPPDAQVFDFTCMNNPAPTTAVNPILLSGTANDINVQTQQPVPVSDATVRGRDNTDQPVGAPDTTDNQGNWNLSLPSGGTPLDGYMEATKQGHRATRVYPPQPLAANQDMIPVPLLSNGTFNTLLLLAQVQQSAANGTVALVVLDCAGTAISGATISVKQADTEVGEQEDLSIIAPGTWVVFNVPPGATEVSGTYNGMPLRAHTIGVAADTTSATILNPGFIN